MLSIHPALDKAIKDYAEESQNIEAYTKYSVLVTEDDQVFVQFDGVPKRGSLTAWVRIPNAAKNAPQGLVAYFEEDEPRTIGYLRNEIDDLDHNLNQARTTLAAVEYASGASSVPSYMLPFLKLTITTSEDLRRRLLSELDELTDDVIDSLERKNNKE